MLLDQVEACGQDVAFAFARMQLGDAVETEVHEGGLFGRVFFGGEAVVEVGFDLLCHAVWVKQAVACGVFVEMCALGGGDGEVGNIVVGGVPIAHG